MRESRPLILKIFVAFEFLLLITLFSLKIEAQVKPQQDKKYDEIIETIASDYGLEPSLIHSIIRAESNYNPRAVSTKGAMGLMQLMPETAKKYGVKNLFDPWENIEGGVRYLKDLIKLYNNQTDLVLAGYNAGQEAIKKYGGIPPYSETKNYIEKIKTSYPNPTIRRRTKIYIYYDASGRAVFTNSRFLYSLSKEKKKK